MNDHRCLSGKYCINRTSDGAAATLKPTLCSACIQDLQGKANKLGDLLHAVTKFIGYQPSSVGAAKVNSSREPQAPLNVRALDLADEIREVIGWVDAPVRDLVSKPGVLFGGRLLSGVDRVLAVGRVWRSADQLIGFEPQFERRAAPCPECLLPTLGMWQGSGTVMCTNSDCAITMPLEEYEKHCIVKSREKKASK